MVPALGTGSEGTRDGDTLGLFPEADSLCLGEFPYWPQIGKFLAKSSLLAA